MSIFKPSKPKPDTKVGYHVSPQMSVKDLEDYLNALPVLAHVIEIAYFGSAGQQVYVVYKI